MSALLQDELKPHFNAILAALEKRLPMPRAGQAISQVLKARVHVELVDARERYLTDALTYVPGTLLLYLEGDPHRPIRRRVLKVTNKYVITEWHEPKRLQRYFDHNGVQADDLRDHQQEHDKLDLVELTALLATADKVPA